MKYLYILLFSCLGYLTCTPSGDKNPGGTPSESPEASWPNVVMYEIFVQSFVDSDGDSIGDIAGMISKLDYLQELGIGGVWLMPIMPSPSYHKYDVTDYFGIHPDYGDIAVFKKFVHEAHKRDIKVMIDMIINHSSNHHPWFLDSKSGESAKHRDYYIWSTDEEIERWSTLEKEETGDSGNLTQWHTAKGNDKKYYGFFTGMMPDLNFDNPEVRKEVIDIARYWIKEVGVDGFRLDAAKHIYEDSRIADNQNWWKVYRSELEKINPDNYLVGEVWDNTEFVAPFLHGLPALFNFDLAFSMLESINRAQSVTAFISGSSWEVDPNTSFEAGYMKNQAIFRNETNDYHDAIFLANHDQNRVLSVLGGDVSKGKLAASILLTMPGTPYLYYGEEIGMLGMKPDENIREPFLWEAAHKDTFRTKWMTPEYSLDTTVEPLSKQMSDEQSIYQLYKKLIHLRNASNALTLGSFEDAHYGNGNLIAFYRSYEESQLLVIHNLGGKQISIRLKPKDEGFNNTLFSTNDETVIEHKVVLEASASIILSR